MKTCASVFPATKSKATSFRSWPTFPPRKQMRNLHLLRRFHHPSSRLPPPHFWVQLTDSGTAAAAAARANSRQGCIRESSFIMLTSPPAEGGGGGGGGGGGILVLLRQLSIHVQRVLVGATDAARAAHNAFCLRDTICAGCQWELKNPYASD